MLEYDCDSDSGADHRLDALFEGSLGYCRDVVSFGPLQGEFRALAPLVEPAGARAALDRFCGSRPDADERACASLWMQWYSGVLVVPVAAMALAFRRAVPVPIHTVGVRIHPEEGRPCAIRLPGRETSSEDSSFALLASLVHDHMGPLIGSFAAAGQVSERVLWGTVGVSLHWTMRQLADRGVGAAGCSNADELDPLFTEREWPDGRPNPIYRTIRPATHGGSERRSVCCLRYRIPGLDRCDGICPVRAERRSVAAAG